MTRTPSTLVDALVIDVHMAVPGRHGETLRPILQRWGLPLPGIAIDLAEFALAGSLTDEVALERFPFWSPGAVRDGLAAVRALDGIEPDLRSFLDARAETAAHRWAGHDDLIARATAGACEALDAAVQSLAVAFRSLPLPAEPAMRLHHVLTGLRYERLGAHVDAGDAAGLGRPDAVALSSAWGGDELDAWPVALTERGLLGETGRITETGRQLRDGIETDTEAGCAAMWAAVIDLDGWLAALGEIDALVQSSRPASS